MTCGSIYKIVFPNGKHYIGLTTTSLEQRTKEHKSAAKYGDTKCIYKAIRKYGLVDTLELVEIDTADTIEELCEKEIGYIIEYNSYYMNGGCGYNMTYGGEGRNGYVFTEEDRQKMSEAQKKHFEDHPEARKEHGERMKKRFENPEEIKKNSERVKKHYEDHPEAREQMSEIKKKYFEENPDAGREYGEKMKKYYKDNPEARKEQGEQIKKYYEDNPEARKEQGERMKKYYEDNPEARKEQGERMKKYHEDNPEMIKKNLDKKGQNKPFDVFRKDGTFVNTFTYQFEAVKYLQTEYKITSTFKISEVLSGTRNSSAGFVFKYK